MTAPTPGGRSPLFIAGVALVGVGVLSGVVGLIGLGTGGGTSPEASASPPPSSAPAEPGTGAPPGDGTTPGASGAPGAPGTPGGAGTSPLTPGAPGTPGAVGGPPAPGAGGSGGQPITDGGASAGGAGGGSGGGAGVAARPAVRVYNNSTVKGLAEKAAEEFRANGWAVSSVQNYPQGVIPATTVYYRPGTAEKTAADEMARKWGMRSEARFAGIQDATPGIIVIITKDFKAA
ncbi:LytR C-terminal domain-containing protein [Pseudonocardia endophytica]|uniref:LytR cell envelope-related transcriptional attenuator n=1 Tax=Pseudonocardia endophytica TaxID=401976 RepID=A0A4R1HGV0_PSEEN|nr:LytR C-terminal domain-containing protein [Pseudonocardia endophytica]TCK20081.1 LytR cell envelope-related transcriptional attenuator [Pseudonocardia endophytica]